MCCFLVKENCTLMPVSTTMLMSVMIHQRGLEGSRGLQQSHQTDFVPCIHYWVITAPLLLKVWPALQHPPVLCSSESLTPPWTSCSAAGPALAAAVCPEAGCSQPCCQTHWWTDTAPGLSLHRHQMPAWTYWPGHCLIFGILKLLLNWRCIWRWGQQLPLRSITTSCFNSIFVCRQQQKNTSVCQKISKVKITRCRNQRERSELQPCWNPSSSDNCLMP